MSGPAIQLHCKIKGIFVDEYKIPIVVNQPFIKPKGGLWTSTFTPDDTFCSDWVDWCASDMPEWLSDECRLLEPEKDAHIYTIDSYGDLERLHNKYPLASPLEKEPILDWEKISKDYDGVHLTSKGQWETRHSRPLNLYGWDCESTLWFKNVFEKILVLPPKDERKCIVGEEARKMMEKRYE